RFPHRTFQEYLAAMHMLEAADFPDQMVKLARQDPDRWREAVLLAMSAARPAMQWAAVEALYGHRPVPEPATICSDEEWWGAFLAGQVLVEAEMLVDVPDYRQTTLQQVRAWHEQLLILGKLTPRDRALAGQVLASLGDPRQGVGVVQRNGTWVPDIAWGEEVPAGAYEVGGDRQAYKGLDRQNIAIERPYRLSRYPITNVQFDSFLEAGDRNNAEWWAGIPEREQSFRDPAFPFANHPRETVSWYQAVVFCRWLTDKFRSALPPGAEITLPHEYEWEVAARWPDGRAYPWGETFSENCANTQESGIGQTTAVGSYPAGRHAELNLDDMGGNVWEWCQNPIEKSEEREFDIIDTSSRALRGGSWGANNISARAAYRANYAPDSRDVSVGFRVVLRRSPSHNER
ncbi:MAG: formylglycine-generating enzyme family protein, partial [Anaerolineales bacterium]|nr:formylglycine-generating enzyme family protein [Anaerolineales bacterium]